MKQSAGTNRILYVLFCLMGTYAALVKHDYGQAAIDLGIALAFDPFDHTIPWKERSNFQKGLLILHVLVVGGLFGASLGK
jgi:hypothetical protein